MTCEFTNKMVNLGPGCFCFMTCLVVAAAVVVVAVVLGTTSLS